MRYRYNPTHSGSASNIKSLRHGVSWRNDLEDSTQWLNAINQSALKLGTNGPRVDVNRLLGGEAVDFNAHGLQLEASNFLIYRFRN